MAEYSSERCSRELYENGETVFWSHTISKKGMNEWVRTLRESSGQPIDWHFAGGRARVVALGDLEAVQNAIRKHRKLHDVLFCRDYPTEDKDDPMLKRSLQGIWDFNGF